MMDTCTCTGRGLCSTTVNGSISNVPCQPVTVYLLCWSLSILPTFLLFLDLFIM